MSNCANKVSQSVRLAWSPLQHSRTTVRVCDKEMSAAHAADRLIGMRTIYCVFIRLTYRDYNYTPLSYSYPVTAKVRCLTENT